MCQGIEDIEGNRSQRVAMLKYNMVATRGSEFLGNPQKNNCIGPYYICAKFGAFLEK